MFEQVGDVDGVARLHALLADLARLDRDVDDATRIDRIRALEELKAAASAAQARDAADFDTAQRAEQAAAGVPAAERGRGAAAQVALARRDSPHRGNRHLGLAKALVHEMPHTLTALTTGRLSEWRATLLVRETAGLTREHRAAVDAEIAGTPAAMAALEQLGDRALAARAKQAAYRLDPHSVVERARRAESQRCVTLRPAPDTMAWLTALLPVRDAISAHTSLTRAAEAARNTGDPRSRGQLMADTLVDAITSSTSHESTYRATTWTTDQASAGIASAPVTGAGTTGAGTAGAGGSGAPTTGAPAARRPGPEDVAVRLVMTDRALLAGHDEPAHLEGYGPVPAAWARDLITTTLAPGTSGGEARARVFVKRLLTDPTGALTAMDSRARLAPTGLAALIRTRDNGTCRTPWCDAPARHIDHITPHSRGGPTTAHDLQGLCETCNHTKELLGWRATAVVDAIAEPGEPGEPRGTAPEAPTADERARHRPARPAAHGRHTVDTTTPTGHVYRSTAPLLPGTAETAVSAAAAPPTSVIEAWLTERLTLAA